MRPSVLDIGGGRYRAALGEGGAIDVNVIECQLRSGAGVEYVFAGIGFRSLRFGSHGALSERGFRRNGDRTGEKRGEGTTVDHFFPPILFLFRFASPTNRGN